MFAPYGADPEDLRERIVESQGRRQESVEFPGFQAAQSEYPSVSDEGDALFMDTVLAAIGVETFSNAEIGCSNSVSSTGAHFCADTGRETSTNAPGTSCISMGGYNPSGVLDSDAGALFGWMDADEFQVSVDVFAAGAVEGPSADSVVGGVVANRSMHSFASEDAHAGSAFEVLARISVPHIHGTGTRRPTTPSESATRSERRWQSPRPNSTGF